jgi:hypothetical protein
MRSAKAPATILPFEMRPRSSSRRLDDDEPMKGASTAVRAPLKS